MSVMMQRKLESRVQVDAESQHTLLPEDACGNDYVSHPDIPRLRQLNPTHLSRLDHRDRRNQGPFQESTGHFHGVEPEEAAAASAHVDILSSQEVRFSADAASGTTAFCQNTATAPKAVPHRSISTAIPRSASPNAPLNRSISARSFRGQFGEDTMHPVEDMAYVRGKSNMSVAGGEARYAEVQGVNKNVYRVYHNEIDVPPELIPVRLKDQYDIALLYAEEDLDEAMALRCFFEKFCVTDTGEVPKVCTIDYNADMVGESKIQHIEDAMKISTYVFLYVTKNFCTSRWAALQKDECLMASLRNPEMRWCIVPVLTQKKGETDMTKAYSIPFGLQSLKPIDISRITYGESLANLMREDPEDGHGVILTERIIKKRDRFFLDFFNTMLSRKLPIRKARQAQVRMEREMFVAQTREELAMEKAKSIAEEEARKFYLARQKEIWEQQLGQRVESGLISESSDRTSTYNSGMGAGSYKTNVAHVDGGPSYHYHFYNSEGASIPAMPPGKQTTVNVHGGGIVQVGDANTATALAPDEERDLYVPDTDVPLQRHFPDTNKQSEEASSGSECSDDLYQSQLSNKEAMYRQEEYARQPIMEQAKSVGYEFEEIHSTQAKEEASVIGKHLSNPGSTHLKDAPGTILQNELCNQINAPHQPEEYMASATGMNNVDKYEEELSREVDMLLSQNSGQSQPQKMGGSSTAIVPSGVPVAKIRHIRPAQGSPTEDDSRNILPRLYIRDEEDTSSSNFRRNTGDIDTSADALQRGTSETIVRNLEDLPSISERVVLGEERAEDDRQSKAQSGLIQRSMSPNSASSSLSEQMSLLEDVVDQEKKEAQMKFAEQYFQEVTRPSLENDTSERQVDARKSHNSRQPALRNDSFTRQTHHQTTIEHHHMKSTGVGDKQCALERNASSDTSVSLSTNESETSLTSLENFIKNEKQTLGEVSLTESESMGSLDDLKDFLQEANHDMERPRAIQQMSINSSMQMDGTELYNGPWSIHSAYPHHLDSQYSLGYSMTRSLNGGESTSQEKEEDLD